MLKRIIATLPPLFAASAALAHGSGAAHLHPHGETTISLGLLAGVAAAGLAGAALIRVMSNRRADTAGAKRDGS